MAEFVFRRTFDVGQRKIMDKINGKIAGIDVKFLFNIMDIQKPGGVLEVDLGKNEVCENAIESNETKVVTKKNSFRKQITLEKNRNSVDSSTKEIDDTVKQKTSLVEKPVVVLKPSDMDTTNEKPEDASDLKALSRSKFKSDEGEVTCGKVLARQDEEKEKVKSNKGLVDLDDRPAKKVKLDNTIKLADDKEKSGAQGHVVDENLDHGQSKKAKLDTSIEMMNDKCKSTDKHRNICSCILKPLVGSIVAPCSREKKTTFFGHLVIDKLRHQMMWEMKEAVSTSHCSQPNTIEYDMAMEWCLQEERSDILWNNLYKQHGKEIRKLKAELKAK